ncbi:Phage integrase family protein [Pseudomonas antarctica]|uniref:Phage integrase family protein n=2 Tax=Gammaproteobacteria TaxID=1236 RepID=A0A1G9Y7F8_9PSED|nr:site-specific integrase [Pseudomonas antarctica]KAF2410407.1 tyrosine recombinase XerC [Pseudomonas antarctica]SDN04987.1 Phage integrase family protein [Pseudomonas antarctica]
MTVTINAVHKDEPNSNAKTDKVVLLDGRIIELSIGRLLKVVDRDGNLRSLNFDILSLGNTLHESMYRAIKNTLSTHSLSYNTTILSAVSNWFQLPEMASKTQIDISEINRLNEISANYRPFVIPLLRRISALGMPGLSAQVYDFLEHPFKWEEQGTGAYFGLLTNDPERGALTEQEIHNIHHQLNRAFSSGAIDQADYTICWFFIGTGVRPAQAHRMKKKDVIIHDRNGMEVTLRVPLAKGEMTTSQEYWVRRAPTVLAECLINYLDAYPSADDAGTDDPLFTEPSSNALGQRMSSIIRKLNTYSERLGTKIAITPYRFRYTLATRALAQGASDYEVARLLTHRSTSCIQYYRASMPELQNPIREALGKEMSYFARAFQGKAISGLHEATRAGDPDAVISDFMRLMGMPVGACGTRAECHQNAPVACLAGCAHFEPLLSAPWEALMASLVEDQELETEPRIRQINHSAMSAIQQIITIRDTSEEAI